MVAKKSETAAPASRELRASGERRSAATLRDLAGSIPAECYERPVARGMLHLVRDLVAYAGVVALLLSTESAWLRPPLWILAAVAVSALFVLGHDAAHGALFDSPRLNRLVGRLALLPSLHAHEVWVFGHNRLHHGYTGCAEIDFVWKPATRDGLAAGSRLQRLLHRFEWSVWGAGLYYLRNVWWAKMVHGECPPRLRPAFRRDRWIVVVYFCGAASALAALGWTWHHSVAAALWLPFEILVVPWLLFVQIIGVVVYLHHIGPDTMWLRRSQWNKLRGRVDGTNDWRAPLLDVVWHNVFRHVAHHIDPRIPFYHLPRASEALAARFDLAHSKPLRMREYLRIVGTCKLYDYERSCWTDYEGRAAERGASAARNTVPVTVGCLPPSLLPARSRR